MHLDGDEIPMTTVVRSRGSGSGCSVWLKFVSQGRDLWLLQSASARAPLGDSCLSGLCTLGGNQSLLLLVIAYCHAVLCCRLSCDCIHVQRLCVDLLIQFVHAVGDSYQTVRRVYVADAMASGGSRPRADRSGIDFRVHVQITWNAPESVVTLESPGVVVFDTSRVSNVLGSRNVTLMPGRWVFSRGGGGGGTHIYVQYRYVPQ